MGDNVNIFWDGKLGKWVLAIGTILGVLLGVFSLIFYFKPEVPNLEIEILSEKSLFYTDETVPQIKIMIDSTDLQKQNKNITIYSLKVINNGTKDISFYDFDGEAVGIEIQNGRIIDLPSLMECSSDHLKSKVDIALSQSNDSLIIIPQTILNIGDFYMLHFFILHDKTVVPSFVVSGKIAGQKLIYVVDNANRKPNNWQKSIQGSFYVQLIRLFVYGASLIILLIIVAALLHWLSLLSKYIKLKSIFIGIKHRYGNDNIVIDDYRKHGFINILRVHKIVNTENGKLTKLYKDAQAYLESAEESNTDRYWKICKDRISVYNELANIGYIIMTNESIVFNANLKGVVDSMYQYYEECERDSTALGYDSWTDEVMCRETKDEQCFIS